ncbi:DUF6436 domain-containing protein [Agaribacter flavus]|uniref:DUF6436 domain-containing protein n=1 Tax=Agaribacter flavus TaxID=1902781 RepID=A0ABV7FJQ5_9ALTE
MLASRTKIVFGVVCWLILCSSLIVWVGASNKSEFDPEMRLSSAIMDMNFEYTVVEKFAPLSTVGETRQLFHIYQGDCFCEWLARTHISKLSLWAANQDFAIIDVNLDEHPELKPLIPSTPAVLAIDDRHRLIYLGPYSRGSGCFSASGQVDDVLKQYVERDLAIQNPSTRFPSATIEVDASGCYCST